MKQDRVIELLKQLGIKLDTSAELPAFWVSLEELQRFAQLVRNEALEEVAVDFDGIYTDQRYQQDIAKVIREMKK